MAVMVRKARKNPAAAALARRRAASLTPEQRKAIAKKAARARWVRRSGG
jgi:hypothetical protein